MNNVNFFNEDIAYEFRGKRRFKQLLLLIAKENNKQLEQINYVFVTDKYLLNLNRKYLKHDTLTDIITFNQSSDYNIIEADIFISLERVRENAKNINISFREELYRVMIHGILHLVGFNDKTKSEKIVMRNYENHYLVLLAQI